MIRRSTELATLIATFLTYVYIFNTTRMILKLCSKVINVCQIITYDAERVRGEAQYFAELR